MCGTRTTQRPETQTRDRSVRASDADRERTAEVLREQAGEGRLEPDELEERLESAFAARTLADLDTLTADLPRRERARHEHPRRGHSSAVSFPVVLAAVITLAIVVHPAIWFALIPLMCSGHGWGRPTNRTAWRGSPS